MFILKGIYFTALKFVFRATRKGMTLTEKGNAKMQKNQRRLTQPTPAYIGATWTVLAIGVAGYLIGVWKSEILLSEKGFYLAVFLLAMFSAVTLQKSVRDRAEGIPVTNVFLGLCWAFFSASVALLGVGLFNAEMLLSEKGFYGISFVLSLFAIVTVQKNVRDMTDAHGETDPAAFPSVRPGLDAASEVVDMMDI